MYKTPKRTDYEDTTPQKYYQDAIQRHEPSQEPKTDRSNVTDKTHIVVTKEPTPKNQKPKKREDHSRSHVKDEMPHVARDTFTTK